MGSNTEGLYVLKNKQASALFSSRSQSVSAEYLHRRLAHANKMVVQMLANSKAISISSSDKLVCEFCQLGKSARLPFSDSSYVAKKPFERIHCNLWGPVLLYIVKGFDIM